MDYVPIFTPRRVKLQGGARVLDDEWVIHKKLVRMESPGDGFTTLVRGRVVGVVVQRNEWSGVVEIKAGFQTVRADLYSPRPVTSVVEVDLPSRALPLPLTVRLCDQPNPQARSNAAQVLGVYTSDIRTADLPTRLLDFVDDEPRTGPKLCQLTDVFKWYEPGWQAAMAELAACPDYQPPDFVHRKSWEWGQTVYGLGELGVVTPAARGLGVGVGWEPLSYFYANRVTEVVATDLYPVDHMWSVENAREGDPRILDNPDDFAPYPYRRENVRFLRMDGKALDFPDDYFDFVWSCSSIEHFGGHEGSAQSMREIERVLKPGGVAAVITEYVLPERHPSPFTAFDGEYFNLRCLHDYLLASVPRLALVEPLDTTLPDYYAQRFISLPEEGPAPHEGIDKPHVVLRTESGPLITSVALFLRKRGGTASSHTAEAAASGQVR